MRKPCIVILANSVLRGKSRLQGVLDPLARRGLMTNLLRRSFVVAVRFAGAANCTVVSHCDLVLQMAKAFGIHTLREPTEGGLSGAANFALQQVRRRGAGDVLMMATDLPRLRVEDLHAMVRTGTTRVCVVIGADRHGTGTNLLFIPAGADMRMSYGPGSLRRHLHEGARAAGRAVVYQSKGAGFDLDTPDDLRAWRWAWGPIGGSAQCSGRAPITPFEARDRVRPGPPRCRVASSDRRDGISDTFERPAR